MEINYFAILLASIFSMILGAIWYGSLFGKQWMEIIGIDMKSLTKDQIKKMQKDSSPYYIFQFIFSIITASVLYMAIKSSVFGGAINTGFILWFGIILPIQASEIIWGSQQSNRIKLQKLSISASYQLVYILAASYLFSIW